MSLLLESTGVPAIEDLGPRLPPAGRLAEGPVAVLECFQEIPCDPCCHSCGRGAIDKPEGLNGLPRVDYARCNGCGRCIPGCPGLAIFVVDQTYSRERGLVMLAYEFLPRPRVGDEVPALDRAGREVCRAEVVAVREGRTLDRTAVIGIAVPKEFLMEARQIKVGERASGG